MDTTTNSKQKKKTCQQMYQNYHAKFPSIPTLTSTEYLQSFTPTSPSSTYTADPDTRNLSSSARDPSGKIAVTLVDVRTRAERKVSMIPNAISLHQFETRLKRAACDPKQWQEENGHLVVTYCTIGYRSGLEAKRLKEAYNLSNVKNLDGIVAYTHACSDLLLLSSSSSLSCSAESAQSSPALDLVKSCPDFQGKEKVWNHHGNAMETVAENDQDSKPCVKLERKDVPCLVDPKTKTPTRKVHVFGSTWDVASDDFETVWFSKFEMSLKGLGLGCKAAVIHFKNIMGKCCRTPSSSHHHCLERYSCLLGCRRSRGGNDTMNENGNFRKRSAHLPTQDDGGFASTTIRPAQ